MLTGMTRAVALRHVHKDAHRVLGIAAQERRQFEPDAAFFAETLCMARGCRSCFQVSSALPVLRHEICAQYAQFRTAALGHPDGHVVNRAAATPSQTVLVPPPDGCGPDNTGPHCHVHARGALDQLPAVDQSGLNDPIARSQRTWREQRGCVVNDLQNQRLSHFRRWPARRPPGRAPADRVWCSAARTRAANSSAVSPESTGTAA